MSEIYNIIIESEFCGCGETKPITICSFTNLEFASKYCVDFNKKHKELPVDEILGVEKIFIQKVYLYDESVEPPDRHFEIMQQ